MREKLEVDLQLRLWLLPGLLGVLLILQIIFPFRGWWILLLALGLALLFSTISIHVLKSNLFLLREMRYDWAQVGDVIEERIVVHNKSGFPTIGLEIIDKTTIPGTKEAVGTSISPYSTFTWQNRLVCTRRGLYRVGPTTICTSDLFGVYRLSIHDPSATNILITPPVIPLPHIQVASGGQSGDGRVSRGLIEQSVAVSTTRDYQPTDPYHHIHWASTAKLNQLRTKVFEKTPTGNWWIIQDMFETVQCGDEVNNTLEAGIILSASLAGKGLQNGKAVGLITNDRQRRWISPQYASDQSMKILRSLALSVAGDISLERLLERISGSIKQTASLVIITPDISLDWWKPLLWLKSKGLIPTILLMDPKSYGSEGNTHDALEKLWNAGIQAYLIQSEMFAEQLNFQEKPLWEWRVFGTGQAIPVKKPKDLTWKRLK
ncbi:MAG: DUF58 domain-containing protein [Brevefilum sp.]